MRVIKLFEPRVLIHLSDEWGKRPDMIELANMAPLLLRQYRHQHYPSSPKNMFQIPLGYMAGFTNGTSAIGRLDIPRVRDRGLQWAFIGNIKQDRRVMIDTFSSALNQSYFVSHNSPPSEIFNVYKNAIFVTNGRGHVVLDCFRLYEASLAGAIPVVVGPWAEVRETFYFGGDVPPWIFEEDWATAAARCMDLVTDMKALQDIQDHNMNWWNRQIMQARARVRDALYEFSRQAL